MAIIIIIIISASLPVHVQILITATICSLQEGMFSVISFSLSVHGGGGSAHVVGVIPSVHVVGGGMGLHTCSPYIYWKTGDGLSTKRLSCFRSKLTFLKTVV